MLAEQRRSRLLELVRIRHFASLPELAEALAVSESTIRRDLDQLEEMGAARRIHGGSHTLLEDVRRKPVSYNGLIAQTLVLGQKLAAGQVKRIVGVVLLLIAAKVVFDLLG